MGNWENHIQVLERSLSLSVVLGKFTKCMGDPDYLLQKRKKKKEESGDKKEEERLLWLQ